MHETNLEGLEWFKKAAREQEEYFLGLPDNSVHHRWAPFTELPENHTALSISHSSTISDLQEIWRMVKLRQPALAQDLMEIMQRQWAVETGRVENLYILSEGATQSLIKYGISMNAITSDPARSMGIEEGIEDVGTIEDIILDQKNVIESLEQRITHQSLNISRELLIELQLAFTETARFTETRDENDRIRVLVRRGHLKNQPNYPLRKDGRIHQYCPFSRVDEEVNRLQKLMETYQEEDIAPEVLAAWLHHRFVQIHPFHDGNGRVARSIASLVLMKAGLLPFTVRLRDRRPYISALEEANRENLGPLVDFIVKQQKETLLSALALSGNRASHVLSIFENRFQEANLLGLREFAKAIEHEIETVLDDAITEVSPARWTNMTYDKFDLVVPHNTKLQRRIVLDVGSLQKLLVYVLELHPKGWGIFVAVGMAQHDGQTSVLFDGQWFPFASRALQSQTESIDAIRSWLRHLLLPQ